MPFAKKNKERKDREGGRAQKNIVKQVVLDTPPP